MAQATLTLRQNSAAFSPIHSHSQPPYSRALSKPCRNLILSHMHHFDTVESTGPSNHRNGPSHKPASHLSCCKCTPTNWPLLGTCPGPAVATTLPMPPNSRWHVTRGEKTRKPHAGDARSHSSSRRPQRQSIHRAIPIGAERQKRLKYYDAGSWVGHNHERSVDARSSATEQSWTSVRSPIPSNRRCITRPLKSLQTPHINSWIHPSLYNTKSKIQGPPASLARHVRKVYESGTRSMARVDRARRC